MTLKDTTILVTGGSRGLGLGLVEALVAHGANVTVVGRNQVDLDAVRERLGARSIQADVTIAGVADSVLSEVRPRVLVLNAGATPRMGPIDELSWSDFSVAWETDVKAGLHWIQAALKVPLEPGARVLVTSSGAAVDGSPLSGGYAGAKRMLWLMAKYANKVAEQKQLGIRFQVLVPRQMIADTGVGDEASAAYSKMMDISPGTYLARFGAPLPPRQFGEHVVTILEDSQYVSPIAFNLKGDTGITVLEGGAH